MSGREGSGVGGTAIPPERQHGFRGQLHRNWHRKVQFPGLHSHRELWAMELLGRCQPVLGRALMQRHTCWVSRFNCHHCMAEGVLTGKHRQQWSLLVWCHALLGISGPQSHC